MKNNQVSVWPKIKSILTFGEGYDSSPIFPGIMMVLLFSVVVMVLAIFCWGVITALGIVGAWETAIQVALITAVATVILPFVSKWRDEVKSERLMRYGKRLKTYDEVSLFLYECQNRSGCIPPEELSQDVEIRLMRVNRTVYLWASEKVQEYWEEYLNARKDGEGGQLAVWHVLTQIGLELGSKYRAPLFPSRPLSFWYNGCGYTISLDKKSTVI